MRWKERGGRKAFEEGTLFLIDQCAAHRHLSAVAFFTLCCSRLENTEEDRRGPRVGKRGEKRRERSIEVAWKALDPMGRQQQRKTSMRCGSSRGYSGGRWHYLHSTPRGLSTPACPAVFSLTL